ncbi:MAG: SRPBCC family protein [Leptolyngbya sp. SIO1D8]|nr:SRPBCC family protein [Leptolyngbya sp. SIO1D8]
MQIKRQFTVNASADRLWEIMGLQFTDVSHWASDIYASRGRNNGIIPQGAPCSGRVCETSLGSFKEQILQYDEQRKMISYDAKGDKMPFFVKHLANNWTFTPLAGGKCKVDMCMEISLLPVFNLLMGPMMRMQMGGVINQVIEELTYFAENGIPHPRKLEVQKELQLKGA